MAIPFKTLRFKNVENQVWGVNFERRVRRKNEDSCWSPLPAPYRLGRVSLAGILEGIRGVHQGRNLYFKPYVSTPILRREKDDVDFIPGGISSDPAPDSLASTSLGFAQKQVGVLARAPSRADARRRRCPPAAAQGCSAQAHRSIQFRNIYIKELN